MSAYGIARQALSDACQAGDAAGVDTETLLRALIHTAAERYREVQGANALRAVLQFQLENAAGDEDYEFMRP